MEIESTNHQSERCKGTSMMRREADAEPSEDVAEPDQMVSGMAGTGQENWNKTGIAGKPEEKSPQFPQKRNREIISLGVLYNGPMNAGKIPDTTGYSRTETASASPESHRDLIFSLYDRQDRIADRLNKKIQRLDRRLTKIEGRGRYE